MTSVEILQQYAVFTQGQKSGDDSIETVAAIVQDLCHRLAQVPDVSHLEPGLTVPAWEAGYDN